MDARQRVERERIGLVRDEIEQLQRLRRRRIATDPNWSRNEAESFRFLHRFAVQAAWQAAAPSSP